MAVLSLVTAPDPRLEIRSEAVEVVTDDIRALMNDMMETMHAHEGIGLAAVQVGVHKRILVMDLSEAEKRYEEDTSNQGALYMVNPEIVDASNDKKPFEEGCLSFPGQRAKVSRPSEVTVRYLDYDGNEQTLHCTGLLAVCVQHELDHLNGVVFIDHISKLKHDMIIKRMEKIKKKYKL